MKIKLVLSVSEIEMLLNSLTQRLSLTYIQKETVRIIFISKNIKVYCEIIIS